MEESTNSNTTTSSTLHAAQEKAQAALKSARSAVRTAEERVEQNAIPFVFGALILGFAIGMAIPRHEATMKERYLDEPLDEIKDMLGNLTSMVQHRGSSMMDTAESKASNLFGSLRKLWS